MHENPSRRGGRSRREQRRRRKARRRRMMWAVTTAAVLLGASATYTAARLYSGRASAPTARAPQTAHAPRTTTESQPATSAPPVPMDLESALSRVTALFSDNRMSVAILDTTSGESATYGEGAFDTASIVKVNILATLLLQAQDTGRELTAQERAYAAAMIQNSDNDSTSALWTEIGSATGLDAANERLGLSETTGGDGTVWGVTQTTARDQIRLLQAVFGDKSPLSTASRDYIQDLMYHIAASQDWGVTAAADAERPTALKNGWLQRSQTKKWDVNSIGRIEKDGRVYFMAVLLNGCSTQEAGIQIVEQAAVATVTAFADTLTD
ncbi:serine hydrolase [Streptomyces sp. NPDC102274]|uniref:serine hydrolase n=1 Tax=Streptomyces sp. NPDC102274 TaxID=3366151 RepID=UPI00381BC00A